MGANGKAREKQPLRGRVVVMTDASSGLGREAAIGFARSGSVLVLGAARADSLEELTRTCEAEGAEALAVEVDVSDPVDVAHLAHEATSRYGRVDVWINSAGSGEAVGRFDTIPLDGHALVIETTLLGALYGSYLAIRLFRRQHEGLLINVSPIAEESHSYEASSAAARQGVIGLSNALRLELEEEGGESRNIRVRTLVPPPVHHTDEFVDELLRLAGEPYNDNDGLQDSGERLAAASAETAEAMVARNRVKRRQIPPLSGEIAVRPRPAGVAARNGKGSRRRDVHRERIRPLA